MNRRLISPLVVLVVAIAGIARFAPGVATVDAVGLVACGALIGVSAMRLLWAVRRG